MALGFPRATGPWGKGQGDDEKETVLQSPMRYLSTRDARPSPATYSFEDVLLAGLAEDGGLSVIMDRCIKVEHARYAGRMHWLGFNTQRITSVRGDLQ